jgi:predicted amidohydrolase
LAFVFAGTISRNRIPVVASNVCGGLFGGRSMIVDLKYDKSTDIAIPKIKTAISVKEQIIIVDIDLKRLRQIRQRDLLIDSGLVKEWM